MPFRRHRPIKCSVNLDQIHAQDPINKVKGYSAFKKPVKYFENKTFFYTELCLLKADLFETLTHLNC